MLFTNNVINFKVLHFDSKLFNNQTISTTKLRRLKTTYSYSNPPLFHINQIIMKSNHQYLHAKLSTSNYTFFTCLDILSLGVLYF